MWTFCDKSRNYYDGVHSVVRLGAVDGLLSLSVEGAALSHSVFMMLPLGEAKVRSFYTITYCH